MTKEIIEGDNGTGIRDPLYNHLTTSDLLMTLNCENKQRAATSSSQATPRRFLALREILVTTEVHWRTLIRILEQPQSMGRSHSWQGRERTWACMLS